MAKDEPTYSEAVRAAAAEAAAALGTNPEAVRQRAIRAHRRPGNNGKARVTLAASIAAAASAGTCFFISCSPVVSPLKRNDRSAPASLEPTPCPQSSATLWRNLTPWMIVHQP
jgi:hypothetical protein